MEPTIFKPRLKFKPLLKFFKSCSSTLFLSDHIVSVAWLCGMREGVQRPHDPSKNDLWTSGFAELAPGPAKLVSQPQWRHQASRHFVSTPAIWSLLLVFIFWVEIKLKHLVKLNCWNMYFITFYFLIIAIPWGLFPWRVFFAAWEFLEYLIWALD